MILLHIMSEYDNHGIYENYLHPFRFKCKKNKVLQCKRWYTVFPNLEIILKKTTLNYVLY